MPASSSLFSPLHTCVCNEQVRQLSLARAATSIIYHVTSIIYQVSCHDKTHLLSQQKYACCNKNFCRNKIMFVRTKYFCCVKTFVVTNNCCNKHKFVTTKVLSWQAYFCRDKRHMLWKTGICHNKHVFVMTKHLSLQKWYWWQLPSMIGNSFLYRIKHANAQNEPILITQVKHSLTHTNVEDEPFVFTQVKTMCKFAAKMLSTADHWTHILYENGDCHNRTHLW